MAEYTISENLQRLINVNNTTRNKFVDRGVDLSPNQNLEAIPDIIDEIMPYDPDIDGFVKLIDFDGTVIAEYTPSEFLALAEYPTPSTHEGLTFLDYNWTLVEAQEYVKHYHFQIIGATYAPTDGKTHLFVTFEQGEIIKLTIQLNIDDENSSFTVEWGDGSTTVVEPDTGAHTYSVTHTYSSLGSYEVKISTVGSVTNIGGIFNYDNPDDPIANDDLYNCLRKVYMSSNITLTNPGAFSSSNKLTEIVLSPNTPRINSGFFSNSKLKALIIPHGTTSIEASGASNIYSYCYLSIPRSMIYLRSGGIGLNTDTICVPDSDINIDAAFLYTLDACWYYKHVIIPDTVVSMNNSAFISGTKPKLVNVRFPKTVGNNPTYISDNTFKECFSLRKITLPEDLNYLYSSCFEGCSSLESIEIPSSISIISGTVFKGCTSLKTVKINDSEESSVKLNISGNSLFLNCPSLLKVEYPKNRNMQFSSFQSMFEGCYSLQEVIFPDSTISASTVYMFKNCRALKYIKLPTGLLSLNDYTFDGCYSLEKIDMGNDIRLLGKYCFNTCYSLKMINSNIQGVANLPSDLEQIDQSAFNNCSLITDINLSKALTFTGQYAFATSGLVNIDYSKVFTTYESGLFKSTKIKEISLSTFPKEIAAYCNKLRTVNVSGNPTTIGESALRNTGILSIEIPESVTSIEGYALYGCSSLKSIKFLGSTPPDATSNTWFTSLPKTCIIYVPTGSLSTHQNKSNYPPKSTYTYVEY